MQTDTLAWKILNQPATSWCSANYFSLVLENDNADSKANQITNLYFAFEALVSCLRPIETKLAGWA